MGDTFGHYTLLERVGAGGLGQVYRARDTKLGRTVAVKIVQDAGRWPSEKRDALLRDARAAMAVSHPSIATLFDAGQEGAHLFLVSEYVAGESLRRLIGNRPLNPKRAIDLGIQLAEALAEGHRRGIIHGDLKPDNILVSSTGRAKILDFGLARWTIGGAARAPGAVSPKSTELSVLSTLAYLSPEQALGEPVDRRTDVFSLGIVLFEMLTGLSPFARANAESTTIQVVQAVLPGPSTLNPQVPIALDSIVQRALMKSIAARYDSAGDIATGLRKVKASLESGSKSDVAAQSGAARPATRAAPLFVLILVIALLAMGAWLWNARVSQLW